jgi:hypothetical protein
VALGVGLSLAGAALLVWQIQSAGPRDVARGLAAIGPGFGLILLNAFVRFVCRAVAWHAMLDPPLPFRRVLAALMAGDALGNVTPFGLLASEPAKALYLGRDVDQTRALAALAIENFFYGVMTAAYIIVGVAVMLLVYDLPETLRTIGLTSLAGMGALLAVAAAIAWTKPTIASALVGLIPSRHAASLARRLSAIEQYAYGAGGRPARLGTVALAQTLFHVLTFVEGWTMVWLLTGQSLPLAGLVFDSVSRAVNVVFKMVPMRAGVDEYGSMLVATALGFPPEVGIVQALTRKARMLTWAGTAYVLFVRRASTGSR